MRRNTRLRSSRRAVRLDFGAIEIGGGLLTPDMVGRVAAFVAYGQTEESYKVPPGLEIRDEIARYFRIGEALWARFEAAKAVSSAASERFALDLLQQCFGFDTLRPRTPIRMGEREFPIRHAALDGRVPVVIAPVPPTSARRSGLDESLPQFGDGSRRRSATLFLQEYLNAAEECVWGIALDGLTACRTSVPAGWLAAKIAFFDTDAPGLIVERLVGSCRRAPSQHNLARRRRHRHGGCTPGLLPSSDLARTARSGDHPDHRCRVGRPASRLLQPKP